MEEIYIIHNLDTFNAKKWFSNYHYYEELNQSKHYIPEIFNANYGKGEHTYKYTLYTIKNPGSDFNDPIQNKKFIVSREYFFNEEINIVPQSTNIVEPQKNINSKNKLKDDDTCCLF